MCASNVVTAHDGDYHLPYSRFQVLINSGESERGALCMRTYVCVFVCHYNQHMGGDSVKAEPFSDKKLAVFIMA
jgi:hypothetical protein